jgi:hypothetical protein
VNYGRFPCRVLSGTRDLLLLAAICVCQAKFACADDAESQLAASAPAEPEGGGQSRPAWQEYTSSYEGIAGRGSLRSFDLSIPEAGLYRVSWRAEVYSLEPQASLSGICSVAVADKALFLDAVPYDQNTPASGFTSRDGNSVPYVYRRIGSEFVAYVTAGADLTLRCASSAPAAAGEPALMDTLLAVSLFARKME